MTRLYHTGYEEIVVPDLGRGRKNADFGQGFYLTPDVDFAERWAQPRMGQPPMVNEYDLELEALTVRRFARDAAWLDYILRNRRGQPDSLADCDVIIGPIANDTLFDTFGLLTSGFLTPAQSLALLNVGPSYRQVVIKTGRAAERLRWLTARTLGDSLLEASRQALRRESEIYQRELAEAMDRVLAE